jgi:hypothetical protein
MCVGDVARSLHSPNASRVTPSTVDSKELLWGVLAALSRIRGVPSHLFSVLLNRSRGILGFESPTNAEILSSEALGGLHVPSAKSDYWQLVFADRLQGGDERESVREPEVSQIFLDDHFGSI